MDTKTGHGWRKAVGALVAALLGVAVLGASADAVIDEPKTIPIEGTEYVITYPGHWKPIDFPTLPKEFIAFVKRYPEAGALMGVDASITLREAKALLKKDLSNLVFAAADIDYDGVGDGDNITVKIYNEPTFTSLKEWTAVGRLSAEATDSEVVSDKRRVMDGRQVFTHIERYPDGVVWANMEVNLGRSHSLSIAMLVDAGGEDVAQAIMDSVQPA